MEGLSPSGMDLPARWPLVVLLAEDDADPALIYGSFLARAGHDVARAENGAQAIEKARVLTPDIVLLDLNMPVLSGEEALRALRGDAETRDLPVAVFTNRELDGDEVRRLERLGIEAIIVKATMPPADLGGWLRRWAEGRGLPMRLIERKHPGEDAAPEPG